jgi:probable addiction module antidote protein
MKHKPSLSRDQSMKQRLRDDPEFAAEYLAAAMEDMDHPQVLLMAMRHIVAARGGMARAAKAAGVGRESLYRSLSTNGNPRLSTFMAVAHAAGLQIKVEAA